MNKQESTSTQSLNQETQHIEQDNEKNLDAAKEAIKNLIPKEGLASIAQGFSNNKEAAPSQIPDKTTSNDKSNNTGR